MKARGSGLAIRMHRLEGVDLGPPILLPTPTLMNTSRFMPDPLMSNLFMAGADGGVFPFGDFGVGLASAMRSPRDPSTNLLPASSFRAMGESAEAGTEGSPSQPARRAPVDQVLEWMQHLAGGGAPSCVTLPQLDAVVPKATESVTPTGSYQSRAVVRADARLVTIAAIAQSAPQSAQEGRGSERLAAFELVVEASRVQGRPTNATPPEGLQGETSGVEVPAWLARGAVAPSIEARRAETEQGDAPGASSDRTIVREGSSSLEGRAEPSEVEERGSTTVGAALALPSCSSFGDCLSPERKPSEPHDEGGVRSLPIGSSAQAPWQNPGPDFVHRQSTPSGEHSAAEPEVRRTATILETPDVLTKRPVTGIAVRLEGDDGAVVGVRLAKGLSDLQVSVHSEIPQLGQALGRHLNSLVGSLVKEGYAVRVTEPSKTSEGSEADTSGRGMDRDAGGGRARRDRQPSRKRAGSGKLAVVPEPQVDGLEGL